MKNVLSLLATAVLLSAVPVFAAEPPKQIDISKLPGSAQVVSDVVIPVPSEIFAVLDKMGKPGWAEVLRSQKVAPKTPGSREQIALLLGAVIAEGFIAVEAENVEEVKHIGKIVLTLSEAISVKSVVIPRSKAIIDGADRQAWKQVRSELDKAQKEVQDAMRELNDEALSQLVSLGGWLRGTEALATVVQQKNMSEGAELLHQPMLLDHFDRQLQNLPKRMKNNPIIGKLKDGIQEIHPMLGKEGSVISEKTVGDILKITNRLVALIYENTKSETPKP